MGAPLNNNIDRNYKNFNYNNDSQQKKTTHNNRIKDISTNSLRNDDEPNKRRKIDNYQFIEINNNNSNKQNEKIIAEDKLTAQRNKIQFYLNLLETLEKNLSNKEKEKNLKFLDFSRRLYYHQKEELKILMEKGKETIEDLNKQLEEKSNFISEQTTRYSELKERYHDLDNKLNRLTINQSEFYKSTITKNEPLIHKIKNLRLEIEDLQQSLDRSNDEKIQLSQEIYDLRDKIDFQKEESKILELKIQEDKEELENSKLINHSLVNQIQEANKKIGNYENEVEKERNHLNLKYARNIQTAYRLNNFLSETNKNLKMELKKEKSNKKKEIEELKEMHSLEIAVLKDESNSIEHLKKENANLKDEIKISKENLKKMEEEINVLRQISDFALINAKHLINQTPQKFISDAFNRNPNVK